MTLTMNIDLENDDYFLCSWNGTEITQIHTKESLIEEYKKTGLFEDSNESNYANDWRWGYEPRTKRRPMCWQGTVIELMDYLIEEVWLFKAYRNDNMTIMYIKLKQ